MNPATFHGQIFLPHLAKAQNGKLCNGLPFYDGTKSGDVRNSELNLLATASWAGIADEHTEEARSNLKQMIPPESSDIEIGYIRALEFLAYDLVLYDK